MAQNGPAAAALPPAVPIVPPPPGQAAVHVPPNTPFVRQVVPAAQSGIVPDPPSWLPIAGTDHLYDTALGSWTQTSVQYFMAQQQDPNNERMIKRRRVAFEIAENTLQSNVNLLLDTRRGRLHAFLKSYASWLLGLIGFLWATMAFLCQFVGFNNNRVVTLTFESTGRDVALLVFTLAEGILWITAATSGSLSRMLTHAGISAFIMLLRQSVLYAPDPDPQRHLAASLPYIGGLVTVALEWCRSGLAFC